ncbi:MAG: hypothetical protein ACYC96_16855 [Fimbriimonadaceae bacterium]
MKLPFIGRKPRVQVVQKPPRGGRPKGSTDKISRRRRTAMEIEEERYLKDLKNDDPARYREIMAARLGIGKQNDVDPLDQVLATYAKFARFQRMLQPSNARGREKGEPWPLEALDKIGEFLDTEGGKQLGEAAKIAVAQRVGAQPALAPAPAQQAAPAPSAPTPSAPPPNAPASGQPAPEIAQAIHEQIQQIIDAIEPPGQPRVDPAKAAETMQKLAMFPKAIFPQAELIGKLITDARNLEPTKKAVAEYVKAQLEVSPGHAELWNWFTADIARLEWLFALVLTLHGQPVPTPNGNAPAAAAGI